MTSIAFDVDGTLKQPSGNYGVFYADEDVRQLIRLCKERLGMTVILWSGCGLEYARRAAREFGVERWVDMYSDKVSTGLRPDITVDDMDCALGKVNLRIESK